MYLRIKKQFQNWWAHSAEKLKRSDLDTQTATLQGEKTMTVAGIRNSAYRNKKKKRKPALSAEKRVPIVSRIPKQFQASIKVTLVKPRDRSLLLISFSLKDGILHFARSTIQKAERRCPG